MIIFVIILILSTVVCNKIFKFNQRLEEEIEKKTAENTEVVKEDKKAERYMIIVCRDSGPYDTLYTNHTGTIEEMGDFVVYKSGDLTIISKNTILEIPIRDKYSGMDEFSSGIDLDDY